MVGRGALGNPWIFRQINAYFTDSCTILPGPGIAQRILVIKRHMDALCEEKGEGRGMREARKHVGWYLHGIRGAAEFRRRAGELTTLSLIHISALVEKAIKAEPEKLLKKQEEAPKALKKQEEAPKALKKQEEAPKTLKKQEETPKTLTKVETTGKDAGKTEKK